MDEVEARLRKERGENIVDLVREKRDLCQAISICQGIGGFHLEFVLVNQHVKRFQVSVSFRSDVPHRPEVPGMLAGLVAGVKLMFKLIM